MGDLDTLWYACCPKCSKPIGRSKRLANERTKCSGVYKSGRINVIPHRSRKVTG